MPALAQVPPKALKEVLELHGWKVGYEDSYNWLLEKSEKDPLPIPKRIKLVQFEIHEHCLKVADISWGEYIELLARTGYKH
jgi:hypothetical protein